MKKALQTTKVADFCLAPFLLLLLTAIPGVFIVHAVRRVAELFFPPPQKKKNFHIWRKTKNFALRLFDARILSLYVE